MCETDPHVFMKAVRFLQVVKKLTPLCLPRAATVGKAVRQVATTWGSGSLGSSLPQISSEEARIHILLTCLERYSCSSD